MDEKSKHRRTNLLYYLKIYDLDAQNHVGYLADISLGGFKTGERLPNSTWK